MVLHAWRLGAGMADCAAMALLPAFPPDHPPWLVACLCAAWCGTCTAYRSTLTAVAAAHPQMRFAWIDIEDDADTLGDDALDIADFPTLMVMHQGVVRFHGPLLPHAATLAQLLQRLAAGTGVAGDAARVPPAMAEAVGRLGPQRPV